MVEHDSGHKPVLPGPVCELLAPGPGEIVADLTVGLGGHAALLADCIGAEGVLIGIDVDQRNLDATRRRLAGAACRVVLRRCNFDSFERVLDEEGIEQVDVLFADLGMSSTQLDDPMRGFSFRHDGPLDMRMDDRLERTAESIVNAYRENDLADVFYFNSQERFSRRIAKRICAVRREKRIKTTTELSHIVCGAMGVNPESRRSKIHPATRVFQALRIAVNQELSSLSTMLEKAPSRLKVGGRIGVVAFHSLEDGIVKRDFRSRKQEGVYELLNKRPIIADSDERERNPRSRSAKFRAAKRMGNPIGTESMETQEGKEARRSMEEFGPR